MPAADLLLFHLLPVDEVGALARVEAVREGEEEASREVDGREELTTCRARPMVTTAYPTLWAFLLLLALGFLHARFEVRLDSAASLP